MKIILNEKETLDKSLNDGYIDDKPTRTMRLLAKHYFGIGQNKRQVVDSIQNFMTINMDGFNVIRWSKTINNVVNDVLKKGKFELSQINKITIYQKELNIISSIDNLRLEKLAFVLLVYAKIYNQLNKNEKNWVNSSLKDIFSDTKMAIGKKDQSLMVNKLVNMGLVQCSYKVDCTNIHILFADNDGDIAIGIDEFRDFMFEYLKFKGENIGVCQGENCSRLIKFTSNSRKYCKECWKIKELEKYSKYNQKR